MKQQLEAFIATHGTWMILPDGQEELVLPLDHLQEFLDMIQPSDVPPERLQHLYRYQAEAVAAIKAQLHAQGIDPDAPSPHP